MQSYKSYYTVSQDSHLSCSPCSQILLHGVTSNSLVILFMQSYKSYYMVSPSLLILTVQSQILLHGVTANSLYLSSSPCRVTNLTTWCHRKQSLLILFTVQSYKSYYMVSPQTVFTYPFHRAKLQILLHGVTANSLYLSFPPCKATNLTTWCHHKQSSFSPCKATKMSEGCHSPVYFQCLSNSCCRCTRSQGPSPTCGTSLVISWQATKPSRLSLKGSSESHGVVTSPLTTSGSLRASVLLHVSYLKKIKSKKKKFNSIHGMLCTEVCLANFYGEIDHGWPDLYHMLLAGQSSSGKLGGREVKTSALVSRRSCVRIPLESPVKFFSTDTQKALSMQCYTHVGVGQNLKNFINRFICCCYHRWVWVWIWHVLMGERPDGYGRLWLAER